MIKHKQVTKMVEEVKEVAECVHEYVIARMMDKTTGEYSCEAYCINCKKYEK